MYLVTVCLAYCTTGVAYFLTQVPACISPVACIMRQWAVVCGLIS
jgi:hypothetical protein